MEGIVTIPVLPVKLSITPTENSNKPHIILKFCQIFCPLLWQQLALKQAFDLKTDSFVMLRFSNSTWSESFQQAWPILHVVF